MKSSLIRTGSSDSLVLHSSLVSNSPRVSVPILDSVAGKFLGHKIKKSPRISLNLHLPIRRVSSESDIKASVGSIKLSRDRSQSFAAIIPEEDCVFDDVLVGGIGSLILTESGIDHQNYAPVDEFAFSGDGIGKGRVSGGGRGSNGFGTGGGSSNQSEIGAYYQEMLKSDPMNSLLLRNYGKYLHEVEGNAVKAEECYGRAILASPGDGELLCLFGKLIWEAQRDQNRAKSYFDQAVCASPEDSMVLGAYAQFMWEAEDEEDMEVSQVAMQVEAY